MTTDKLFISKSINALLGILFDTVENFDKRYKFTIGERLIDETLELNRRVIIANSEDNEIEKVKRIKDIRLALETIKLLLSVCEVKQIIKNGKFGEIALLIVEIGKQATAWKKYYTAKLKE